MKTWTMLVAMLGLVLCLGVATQAADKPAKPKIVKGEITKIDGASVTVQPPAKKGADKPEAVVVTTTDATVVTINGEKKAVGDLVVGQKVGATLDADGKALSITVADMKKPARGAAKK